MNSFTFVDDTCTAFSFWAEGCHPVFQTSSSDVIYVAETPVKAYPEHEGIKTDEAIIVCLDCTTAELI